MPREAHLCTWAKPAIQVKPHLASKARIYALNPSQGAWGRGWDMRSPIWAPVHTKCAHRRHMCTFDSPIASILNLPVVATCLVLTSIPAIAALQVHVEHLRLRVSALYKWSEIERVRRFTSVNNDLCFLGLHCLHRLLGSCGCCLCCLLGHLVEHGKGVNLRECECHSRLASLSTQS